MFLRYFIIKDDTQAYITTAYQFTYFLDSCNLFVTYWLVFVIKFDIKQRKVHFYLFENMVWLHTYL